jgi:formiminotetrahydrofolate cyclodeaminase
MNSSIDSWFSELAAKQPTPGGGAVAALSAAAAAGLLGMVTIYTAGPKWQNVESRMLVLNVEVGKLRQTALELMDKDAEAFSAVGAAFGLPKATDEQKVARQAAIERALINAAEPPTHVAVLAERLVEIADEIAPLGNPNVISDVAVAASQARAALESAIINIAINQKSIKDEAIKIHLQKAIEAAELAAEKADLIVQFVRQRMTQ